jgi:hypothetical protein
MNERGREMKKTISEAPNGGARVGEEIENRLATELRVNLLVLNRYAPELGPLRRERRAKMVLAHRRHKEGSNRWKKKLDF